MLGHKIVFIIVNILIISICVFLKGDLNMIVNPKFRGFICTTAHPVGCAHHVQEQIDYVKSQGKVAGPKKVLIIGSSTGFGLSSRIVSAFGCGADTIGICFEKAASGKKTATAGWYNTVAFENAASDAGYYAKTINGDAFSNEIKNQTIELIKKDLGQVDMVIYSIASPRRTHPITGEVFNSVIKPIDKPYSNKTMDFHNGTVSEITVESATEEEVNHTIGVMGGEDWEMWINALSNAGALAKNAITFAFSYLGPSLTHSIYHEGTIGRAKNHLDKTAKSLAEDFKDIGLKAYISVNKALVTQASSAIPVVPLYISILFKIMKEKKLHEGCIEQMYRLFANRLYGEELLLDDEGRIRIDDLEMRDDVQAEVIKLWENINSDNIYEMSDLEGYRKDFFNLFGFGFAEIDYTKDVETEINIPSGL